MAARKKLTPQLAKKICGLIVDGNFASTSAVICGVPKTQHEAWLKLGRETNAALESARASGGAMPEATDHAMRCGAYVESIEAAEAELENAMVSVYAKHAKVSPDSVNGIPKFLASRFKAWREDKRVQVSGDQDTPLTLIVQTVEPAPKSEG